MPDRIEETMRTLAPDVDRIGLADPGAVRRRGDRRTRNQALGSVLAAVAVVAGVLGVAGGPMGDRETIEAPPAEPTVSTSPEQLLSLAGPPLLRDGDLTGVGPFGDFLDSGNVPRDLLLRCIDVPAVTTGAKRVSTVLYEPEIGEPTVHEHAVSFPSESGALEFVTGLSAAFSACDRGDPAQVRVDDRGPEAIGRGLRASRLTTPTRDAGIGYYELGLISERNMVVVLEWSSMGNPVGEGPDDWVWTAERLETALDRAIGVG